MENTTFKMYFVTLLNFLACMQTCREKRNPGDSQQRWCLSGVPPVTHIAPVISQTQICCESQNVYCFVFLS